MLTNGLSVKRNKREGAGFQLLSLEKIFFEKIRKKDVDKFARRDILKASKEQKPTEKIRWKNKLKK